jgi:GNAT superfamily N-acetyltransferase
MTNLNAGKRTGLPEARVREATAADLARIVELLAHLALDGRSREAPGSTLLETYRQAFQAVTADPRQRLLVVEVQGRVIGTATLVIIPNLSYQGRPYGIVENIVVDAAARGFGYGEVLLRSAIDEARRAGCYKLSLTSNKRRTNAHRFYERVGFKATHEGYRLDL